MVLEHEYAIRGGINRSKLGLYIGLVAAVASSVLVYGFLTLIDVAKAAGLSQNLPPVVISSFGTSAVFGVLYWVFDRHGWKWQWFSQMLRLPNLNGDWHCFGQTINPDKSQGFVWQGQITIVQSWDRIRVRLKTAQSGSNSISATLVHDEADGYRLLYNYLNEPGIGESEMSVHRGFAELVFAKDLQTASGEYFNGHGRQTFGTVRLSRGGLDGT